MSLYDHLEKLQYFMSVAQAGSFKRASEQLLVTQPTLSKSIKILEESLQVELFIRHARGVELTQEGEFLRQRCQVLFHQLDDIAKELHESPDPLEHRIRVGTFDSIAIYFWASFLKRFLLKKKHLQIEMRTKRSAEIQKELEEGQLDLAIIVNPRSNSQFEELKLFDDQFRFYESTTNQKCYSSLEEAPLILMSDTVNQKELKAKLGRHSPTLHYVSSLESAKEFCLQGLGVALLPELVAQKALKENKLQYPSRHFRPYSRALEGHHISLVYPKKLTQSITLKDMIEELLKSSQFKTK